MFLKLRIIFTILSAICAGFALLIGTWFNLTWAIITAIAGVAFFILMLICKQEQEKREPIELNEEQQKENSNENVN